MKISIFYLFLCLFSPTIHALDTSLSIGYSVSRIGWFINSSDSTIEHKSAGATLTGPMISFTHKRFFAGFEQLSGSYHFRAVHKDLFDDGAQPSFDYKSEVNADTSQQEYYVGFRLLSNFSIIYGKTSFEYEAEKTNIIIKTGGTYPNIKNPSVSYSGDFFGFGVSGKLNPRVNYFGRLLQINLSRDKTNTNRTAEGHGLDVGLSLYLAKPSIVASAWISRKNYKHNFLGGSEDHVFSGLRLRLDYRFNI